MSSLKTVMLKLSPGVPEEAGIINKYESLPRQRRGDWLRNTILRGMTGTGSDRGALVGSAPAGSTTTGTATSGVKGILGKGKTS